MMNLQGLRSFKDVAVNLVKSPKTIAVLELGVAVIAVIHAVDKLRNSSKTV